MLEFEVAERLLLAAQFRKDEINPVDYIYRAIGSPIQPISVEDEEVELILQYMYKSEEVKDHRVDAIFRVGGLNTGKGKVHW